MEFDIYHRYAIAQHYYSFCMKDNEKLNSIPEWRRVTSLGVNLELAMLRYGKVDVAIVEEYCIAVADFIELEKSKFSAEYWKEYE